MPSMGEFSSRTVAQSASSSSHSNMAAPVCVPCPISEFGHTMVTVSSGLIVTYTVTCPPAPAASARRAVTTGAATTSAPATVAVPRNWRRVRSNVPFSSSALIVRPPPRA